MSAFVGIDSWTDSGMDEVKASALEILTHLRRSSIEAMIDRFNHGKVDAAYWYDETECGCYGGTALYFYLNERSEGGVVHTWQQMYSHTYEVPFKIWTKDSDISLFFWIEVPTGATPETNEALALVVKWMRDYLAELPE